MATVQDHEPLHKAFPELFEINFVTTFASVATNASKTSDWLHREEYSDLVQLRHSADKVKYAALALNSTIPGVQLALDHPDFGRISSHDFQRAMAKDRERFKAFGPTVMKTIHAITTIFPLLSPATLEGRILSHLHNLTLHHNNATAYSTITLLATTSKQINHLQTTLLTFEDHLNNTKETTIIDMCKHSLTGDSAEHSVDCLAELRGQRLGLRVMKDVAQFTKGIFVVGRLEAEGLRDALVELRGTVERAGRVPHLMERVGLGEIFDGKEGEEVDVVGPEEVARRGDGVVVETQVVDDRVARDDLLSGS
ncbi:hypothetical protein LTR78_004669 [Recurvomyces mirabilis]|uniref:Uncharacterized protein n=2 Tax=Recurvomyces mirabilis TaxID=574656 RepID=A0AAE0WPH8_9PEZI|nr:hypothetical protein LTR78_004669 [Recurvomyces mirabilis]